MPTNKQKELAKELLENPRQTMGDAMTKVGYAPTSAIHPKDVTESKGWNELLDTMLPDDKILLRHAEGLDSTKVVSSHTEPDYTVPDYAIRKQYVELAYRVKGRLKETAINVLNTGGDMTLEFTK